MDADVVQGGGYGVAGSGQVGDLETSGHVDVDAPDRRDSRTVEEVADEARVAHTFEAGAEVLTVGADDGGQASGGVAEGGGCDGEGDLYRFG